MSPQPFPFPRSCFFQCTAKPFSPKPLPQTFTPESGSSPTTQSAPPPLGASSPRAAPPPPGRQLRLRRPYAEIQRLRLRLGLIFLGLLGLGVWLLLLLLRLLNSLGSALSGLGVFVFPLLSSFSDGKGASFFARSGS